MAYSFKADTIPKSKSLISSKRKSRNLYPFGQTTGSLNNNTKDIGSDDWYFHFCGCKIYRVTLCKNCCFPCLFFGKVKYNGKNVLTRANLMAGLLHFILATVVILVSILNSKYNDSKESNVYIGIGCIIAALVFTIITLGYYILDLFLVHRGQYNSGTRRGFNKTHEKAPIICFTSEEQKIGLRKKMSNYRCACFGCPFMCEPFQPIYSIIIGLVVLTLYIIACILIFPQIEGSYPVVLSTSIVSLDKVPAPYDSSICDGVDYKDKSALEWIDCLRENPQARNRTLFDPVTGEVVPWRSANNAGGISRTCEWLLKNKKDNDLNICEDSTYKYPSSEDTIKEGYTAEEACVGCADNGGGGEICGSTGIYACLFNSNLQDFETISGSDYDPTRVIPKPTFNVLAGNDENPLFAWVFIWSFSLITSLFHLYLALMAGSDGEGLCTCCGKTVYPEYINWIKEGRSPIRWLEYSITASIMFTLVLTVNRVTDVFIIVFAFIISMSYNTFGAAIDYINEPCVVVWMWMVSFIGFIGQFICLFINFNLAIQPYIDSKENPGSYMLWGQFFDIITIVNWGLLLSFSTFPIVNLFHQCYKYKPQHNSCFSIFNCFSLIEKDFRTFSCSCNDAFCCSRARSSDWEDDKDSDATRKRNCMARTELSYILFSFTSKTLLVLTMLIGTSFRRNRN